MTRISFQRISFLRFSIQFLTLALFIAALIFATVSLADESGWTVLFDGKNIDQWDIISGGEWIIEEGVLIGKNGKDWSTDPEKNGSYLRTKKMYGDFVLELDYSINERGNSGVHLRCAADKNPSFTGYEMQITDCFGKTVNEKNAGLYDAAKPIKNCVKPAGQFNKAIITVQGQNYTIMLNGENYVAFTGDRRTKGFIGLQNHDERSVVKFKNIRIKEL